ncbi:MAG: hypothetical protein WCJ02_12025 [bacterium]
MLRGSVVVAWLVCGALAHADDTLLSHATHPFETQIQRFMAHQQSATSFQPTGLTRSNYLAIVYRQVCALQQHVRTDGDLIDPVDKKNQFAPPCYAHSVATLVASGYTKDPALLESGMKAMDFSVQSLQKGAKAFKDRHPDFYTYPVMLAFEQFEKCAPQARLEQWRTLLGKIDPKATYATYGGKDSNWTLVHTAGEYLRSLRGFTKQTYVAHILAIQRFHMTPEGLYLEHGAPFAYDAFSRYFLTGMLQRGYQDDFYRDACWKGAWTSLLMQSPFGELPTGYRSAQHIWNEAELAKVYEIYAAAYAKAGKKAEAGAFKRGAHLALASIGQWIRPDGSGYIVKNRFPTEARHGYEGYSVHANYNLLACSMLCAAWLMADDSIAEMPAPADVGGYILKIPAFNMVVAHAGGTYLQYMTCGNKTYNPTGIIRVHLRDGHPQLGYSDGRFKDSSLSANQVEILQDTFEQVTFKAGDEMLTVNRDGVTVENPSMNRVAFPMLVFNGREKTDIQITSNIVNLKLEGKGVQVEITRPREASWKRSGEAVKHRNGDVERVTATTEQNGITYIIRALSR